MYFYTILSKHLNRAKTELLVSKRQDEVNYELHFKYIEAIEKYINKKNDYNKFDFAEFKKSDRHQRIIRFYKNNFKSNEKLKNISNLFLALHFTNIQDIKEAENYLTKVKTTEVPYYYYIKGKFLAKTKDYKNLAEAEKHLLQARKENLGKEVAKPNARCRQKNTSKYLTYKI